MIDARQLIALPPPVVSLRLGEIRQGEAWRWHRLKEPAWLTPHPASQLAHEDALLGAFAGSHVASRALAVGGDNLLAALQYTQDPTARPAPFATFTLARAAIEAAATALWIVGPRTRGERLANALSWYAQDDTDLVTFVHNLTAQPRHGHREAVAQHIAPIFETARRLGLAEGSVSKRLTSTTMLTAQHMPTMRPMPFLAWSAASGFAHARTWPIEMLQLREPSPGRRLRVTARPGVVLWLAATAAELLNRAEMAMRAQCRPPRPRLSATTLSAAPLDGPHTLGT